MSQASITVFKCSVPYHLKYPSKIYFILFFQRLKSHIFPVDGLLYVVVIDVEYKYIFHAMWHNDHTIIRIRCHSIPYSPFIYL